MQEKIAQEEMERIEVLRREIEELGYPSVWVGEVGMTAEQLLYLQDENDAGPEYMRVEPGELVGVEGSSGGGIRIPRPGGRRIYAPEVLRHLGGEMQPEAEVELRRESAHTQAARRGNVLVYVADVIEWKPKELLTREDMFFLLKRAGTGRKAPRFALKDPPPVVGVFTGPRYEEVSLDDLTPEHVDEELFERMELYANDTRGPYVVPETPKVEEHLAEFGEYFGGNEPSAAERGASFAAGGPTRNLVSAMQLIFD